MTSQNYRAKIRLSARSKKAAASIRDALTPDLERLPKSESATKIVLKGSDLVIDIEASDVASLRTSINSHLLLADASYRCTAL